MITMKDDGILFFSYLATWQPHYFHCLTNIYPGVYALIGAVSFLGGVKRMILSFSVILIECTNEISLGLPILLTHMVSCYAHSIIMKSYILRIANHLKRRNVYIIYKIP